MSLWQANAATPEAARLETLYLTALGTVPDRPVPLPQALAPLLLRAYLRQFLGRDLNEVFSSCLVYSRSRLQVVSVLFLDRPFAASGETLLQAVETLCAVILTELCPSVLDWFASERKRWANFAMNAKVKSVRSALRSAGLNLEDPMFMQKNFNKKEFTIETAVRSVFEVAGLAPEFQVLQRVQKKPGSNGGTSSIWRVSLGPFVYPVRTKDKDTAILMSLEFLSPELFYHLLMSCKTFTDVRPPQENPVPPLMSSFSYLPPPPVFPYSVDNLLEVLSEFSCPSVLLSNFALSIFSMDSFQQVVAPIQTPCASFFVSVLHVGETVVRGISADESAAMNRAALEALKLTCLPLLKNVQATHSNFESSLKVQSSCMLTPSGTLLLDDFPSNGNHSHDDQASRKNSNAAEFRTFSSSTARKSTPSNSPKAPLSQGNKRLHESENTISIPKEPTSEPSGRSEFPLFLNAPSTNKRPSAPSLSDSNRASSDISEIVKHSDFSESNGSNSFAPLHGNSPFLSIPSKDISNLSPQVSQTVVDTLNQIPTTKKVSDDEKKGTTDSSAQGSSALKFQTEKVSSSDNMFAELSFPRLSTNSMLKSAIKSMNDTNGGIVPLPGDSALSKELLVSENSLISNAGFSKTTEIPIHENPSEKDQLSSGSHQSVPAKKAELANLTQSSPRSTINALTSVDSGILQANSSFETLLDFSETKDSHPRIDPSISTSEPSTLSSRSEALANSGRKRPRSPDISPSLNPSTIVQKELKKPKLSENFNNQSPSSHLKEYSPMEVTSESPNVINDHSSSVSNGAATKAKAQGNHPDFRSEELGRRLSSSEDYQWIDKPTVELDDLISNSLSAVLPHFREHFVVQQLCWASPESFFESLEGFMQRVLKSSTSVYIRQVNRKFYARINAKGIFSDESRESLAKTVLSALFPKIFLHLESRIVANANRSSCKANSSKVKLRKQHSRWDKT